MAKITVVAIKKGCYSGEMRLTPKEMPNRAQFICNAGIFNLMGIDEPGTYTIECTRVVKRARIHKT